MKPSRLLVAFAAAMLPVAVSQAADKPELRIGAVLALTGPASSLGLPEKNATDLREEQLSVDQTLPFRVKFITYDDASDPTKAVNSVRKLITEDKVHVVICCTTTPASMATLDTMRQMSVPNISLALGAGITEPAAERKWIFKTTSTDNLQVGKCVDDILRRGAKTVAFMGLDDSFGEGGWRAVDTITKEKNLKVVAAERFARTDTNFLPQALKVKQANPDAIFIHAIPPSSALVQQALRRVGVTAPIYHAGGAANTSFITIGKADVEGALVAMTPVPIYKELTDGDPLKTVIAPFVDAYKTRFKVAAVDGFPGQAWDAVNIAVAAADAALKSGASFDDLAQARSSIREKIETTTKDFVALNGIFNYSPTDHLGLDYRAIFLTVVKDGHFKLYNAK